MVLNRTFPVTTVIHRSKYQNIGKRGQLTFTIMFFEENGIENVGCGIDLAEVFIIVVDLILNWSGGGSPDAKTFGEIEVTRKKLPNTTLAPTKLLKILILGKTCCFS